MGRDDSGPQCTLLGFPAAETEEQRGQASVKQQPHLHSLLWTGMTVVVLDIF